MKLSKNQEKEIIQVYKTYFDSYINGDTRTIADLLDDNYNQIGSADGEVFFNKKEALRFLYETIDQIEGKTQIRNRRLRVDPLDGLFLITDLFDIYVLIEKDWAFYARFRASTLMQRKEDGWKFVHQHSSMPDSKTKEGENIAIEIIAEENLKLREAVKRRTIELEQRNRELEIEASLEKVRISAIAMRHSDELSNPVGVLFEELGKLGVHPVNTYLVLYDLEHDRFNFRMTGKGGNRIPYEMTFSFDALPQYRPAREAWESGEPVIEVTYTKENRKDWLKLFAPMNKQLPKESRLYARDFPDGIYNCSGRHAYGSLGITHARPANEEEKGLLVRFAREFEIAYQRYIDITKAEAQAREAQIEAAMERVRSRTMAMQGSEEIADIVGKIFEELGNLDLVLTRVLIWIFNEKEKYVDWWSANSELNNTAESYRLDFNQNPVFLTYMKAWEKRIPLFKYTLSGGLKISWEDYIFNNTGLVKMPVKVQNGMRGEGTIYTTSTISEYGLLMAGSKEPLSDENTDIIQRFGRVFQQSYTRYLDVQKAEAQAREAQIEAALERVRARSMAMQNSEELNQLIGQIYIELSKLDMVLTRTSLLIVEPDKKSTRWWMANSETPSEPMNFFVKYHTHPPYLAWLKAWQNREQKWIYHLKGKVKKEWDEYIFSETELTQLPDKVIRGMMKPDHVILTASFGNFGALEPASLEPLSDEQIDILIRFTKVFEQTYTRFLDLQKAETQAREAQIEASLERIRARAMAMQKSDELRDVVGLVSEELKISLENTICIIMNFNWRSKEIEWWSTGFNIDNLPESYKIPIRDTIKDHPLIRHYREALRKGISYNVYKLEGEIKRSFEKYIFEQSELKKIPLETQNWMRSYEGVISNQAFMSHGVLQVDGPEQLSDEKAEILQRFAKVVDLTYTRVEDLQQAEARALETERQASLDRVRGVIASMRTKEDLNRITPLIWKELKALDVPFIRCGVFIMDVDNEIIQSYLSTPDGRTLGIFDLPFTSELIGELMVNFWQQGKIFKEHWTKAQFIEFMQRLKNTGQITDPESYQGATVPPENLDLHFIPFKQGMLYVGNTAPLIKKELQLVQSLADAFSIAYARYEDFRKLELAKKQIENALVELKATQAQLIHSEKMASLGELTAGIAHEIQNPLNFVNNFSEVSEDLIDEMLEGLLAGNMEEVENIISDLKQNLQKINHHGKRASSIVHGMLEHSRTGNQEREPTDINLLADEYLRLAYHGLRAKNKSFHAEFTAELDESLPKVNLIAQDIGRVLLNLINNAFYAVDKKAKEGAEDYKPLVIVSTKKVGEKIEVAVKDNGSGIPAEIKDKIFQPFFTTKPTGSGTGLGLSLSYDIVKAHGGELNVESNGKNGTIFLLTIPNRR